MLLQFCYSLAQVSRRQHSAALPGRRRPVVDDDGIPRRVRGAQLPDLGPAVDDGPAFAPPDPELVRGRLSALISGVEHGRAHGGPGGGS